MWANTREPMPEGGTLVIKTQREVVDGEHEGYRPGLPPGEYVALVVSDTGVGMTEEVSSRMFEPFFTTKEVGRGTEFQVGSGHPRGPGR